jgi:hypothetical protein
LQYHHIFPKSLLKNKFEKSEINEFSNMAFIASKTNKSISNSLPKDYIADVISKRGPEAILDQCVPVDPAMLEIENYRQFLEKRRQMLAELVNTFVESVLI